MVVKPDEEEDIIAALRYARDNDLTIVTANGKRAPFVPVTSRTLYLDMCRFKDVALDKAAGTVRVEGGVLTGEVIGTVTKEGYYTLWPNSNAVGYVGCVMGGGSDTMNGLHGYMIDAVEGFEVITPDGVRREVSPRSTGKGGMLFNALCGAGYGLGIVTAVVMKAFPLEKLGLTDNRLWTRRVILPASAVGVAARIFAEMTDLPPALTVTIVCARSPPNSPNPGAPIIMFIGSYVGPGHKGEKAAAALFDSDLVGQSISAVTELVPFGEANLPSEPLSANGGHKGFSSTFLSRIETESVVDAVNLWVQLGEDYPDARPTTLVLNKWDTRAIAAQGASDIGRAKFVDHRHQSMIAFAMRWCSKEETRPEVEKFGDEFLAILRRGDPGPYESIANNMRPGMDLRELWSAERLVELWKLKKMWDPQGLLWSPAY